MPDNKFEVSRRKFISTLALSSGTALYPGSVLSNLDRPTPQAISPFLNTQQMKTLQELCRAISADLENPKPYNANTPKYIDKVLRYCCETKEQRLISQFLNQTSKLYPALAHSDLRKYVLNLNASIINKPEATDSRAYAYIHHLSTRPESHILTQ